MYTVVSDLWDTSPCNEHKLLYKAGPVCVICCNERHLHLRSFQPGNQDSILNRFPFCSGHTQSIKVAAVLPQIIPDLSIFLSCLCHHSVEPPSVSSAVTKARASTHLSPTFRLSVSPSRPLPGVQSFTGSRCPGGKGPAWCGLCLHHSGSSLKMPSSHTGHRLMPQKSPWSQAHRGFTWIDASGPIEDGTRHCQAITMDLMMA